MKKRILILFLVLAICCGCAPSEKLDEDGNPIINIEKEKNSLVLQMRKPDTLHPLLTRQKTCMQIFDLIYDSLVTIGEGMKAESRLAESWKVEDNGKKFVITTRSDVLWHTGQQFSAYDAAYSINFVKNTDTVYTYRLADMLSATAINSNTLEIYLSRPNGNFINMLTFPIIAKDAAFLESKPVGTGQYKFDSLTERKKMTLRANENFFLGKPAIQTVEVLFFSSAANAMDAFGANVLSTLSADEIDFQRFSVKDFMKTVAYPTNEYEFLAFNYDKMLFQNEKIRQAISAGIHREELINSSIFGVGLSNVPINPESALYDKTIDTVSYSTEQAKQMLQADGFGDRDTDGILDKDGVSIAFEILVNENDSNRVEEAKQIAKTLGTVGMKVRCIALPWEDYINALASGEFDAFIGGVDMACHGDLSFLLSSNGIANYARYRSAVMDLRLEGIDTSQTQEEMAENIRKFMRFFVQNQPIVGLYFKNNSLLYHSSLENVEVYSENIYANVYKWEFKNPFSYKEYL